MLINVTLTLTMFQITFKNSDILYIEYKNTHILIQLQWYFPFNYNIKI